MKDSKTIRNEHQSFVDAYKKINQSSVQDKPVEEGYGYKSMDKKKKKTKKEEMVLVRKSNAFTALAEKYNMSPKQFGRYVEANQHLFDIPTRRKATLANKFQGFKETKEWDEFFGDLELVEGLNSDNSLKKVFKLKKGSKEQQMYEPTASEKKDKLKDHELGLKLDKAHYEPEGELVDEGAPYTVHYADKIGNTPAYQNFKKGMKNKLTGKPLYKAGVGLDKASYEPEGEELQEITTKDTKSGTKFKVRVKDKATGSSYIRFATRDKIAQLRSDPKIASVEMTDEGQTPEERGEKKAQAAGGGSQKKAKKDYDGDGKVETGSQEYLGSRDKAIKKAMKKRSVTTEETLEERSLEDIRKGAVEYELTKNMSDKTYKNHLKRTGNFRKMSKKEPYSYKHLEEFSNEETLEERVRGGGVSTQRFKSKEFTPTPQKGMAGGQGNPTNRRGSGAKPRTTTVTKPTGSGIVTPFKDTSMGTKYRSTAEIRAKDKAAGGTGMSNIPSKGGSVVKKPEVSTMTRQGKPRTKAQMMAAKRIASGKSIQDVKDANTASMKAKAAERFKAFKARRMAKEELSDWRQDLKEIMGEVEKTEGKKSKSKKMKNGVCINPDTDDEKNKYEEVNAKKIAENLGANLQSLKIEDADGNVAYEVVDLVKPDPIKENVLSEVEGTNMFPKGTQKRVKSILDKGSEFMNTTKVGGVLKKIFGPSNPKNQGSDYTPSGKVAR